MARTWLDQYEILYNFTLKNSELKEDCGGKPSKIIDIRKNLQCKNFEWYINNIYPELMVPSDGDFAFGQIHTRPKPQMGFTQCVDMVAMGSDDGLLGLNGCLLTYTPQLFRYTFDGQIVHDDFCVTQISTDPGTSVRFLIDYYARYFQNVLSQLTVIGCRLLVLIIVRIECKGALTL